MILHEQNHYINAVSFSMTLKFYHSPKLDITIIQHNDGYYVLLMLLSADLLLSVLSITVL